MINAGGLPHPIDAGSNAKCAAIHVCESPDINAKRNHGNEGGK